MSGFGLIPFMIGDGAEAPWALVYTGGIFVIAALLLARLGHGTFWGGVSLGVGCLVIGSAGAALLAGGLVWRIQLWRRRKADPQLSSG